MVQCRPLPQGERARRHARRPRARLEGIELCFDPLRSRPPVGPLATECSNAWESSSGRLRAARACRNGSGVRARQGDGRGQSGQLEPAVFRCGRPRLLQGRRHRDRHEADRGPDLSISGMVAGQIDAVAVILAIDGANANLKKPGVIKFISLNAQSAKYRMEQFVVRKGYEAKTLADLKGAQHRRRTGARQHDARQGGARQGWPEGRRLHARPAGDGQHVNVLKSGPVRRRLHAGAGRNDDGPDGHRQDDRRRHHREHRSR